MDQALVTLFAADVTDLEREAWRRVSNQPPQEARVMDVVPAKRLVRVLRKEELRRDHQERRPALLRHGDEVVRRLVAVEEGDGVGYGHILHAENPLNCIAGLDGQVIREKAQQIQMRSRGE